MPKIKLSITINRGKLTLIRCYTYAKRKRTKFLDKIPLDLSNPFLSYTADPVITKIWEIA